MHENRYFLSYRKRHPDTENHVHVGTLLHSGELLQNGCNHKVTDLEKIQFESPRMNSNAIVSSWVVVTAKWVVSCT